MKRITTWALYISIGFLLTAGLAFIREFFLDATILALFGTSGIFFLMAPQRTKDHYWHSFKVISYLFLLCALTVSVFKYVFWDFALR